MSYNFIQGERRKRRRRFSLTIDFEVFVLTLWERKRRSQEECEKCLGVRLTMIFKKRFSLNIVFFYSVLKLSLESSSSLNLSADIADLSGGAFANTKICGGLNNLLPVSYLVLQIIPFLMLSRAE